MRKGLFPDIPIMEVSEAKVSEASDYGAGNTVVTVSDTTLEDYRTYLAELEKVGPQKYVDNEAGLGGTVFSATYTMGKWVITATHTVRTGKTYISSCYNLPLSEHLLHRDEYITGNREGSRTKIHMLELWYFGNSFVIQLKNGHFIISDGGFAWDTPYLLNYLDGLVPDGEIPVVEAWIFSHGHVDHCGVMGAFMDYPEYRTRLFVEGLYYNEPNNDVTGLDPGARVTLSWIKGAAGYLQSTKGLHPDIYRPQTGQRYYFSDITMDIVHAQEQLLAEDYSGDFNDSSTWCLFTIEGQKCLFSGDGEKGCMKMLMEHYTEEYLNVDVLTLMHHGFNTQDSFTDYCRAKTLLITKRGILPVRKVNENTYLKEQVQEYYSWEDGTKVLTFPYEVGKFETRPNFEWIYHKGQQRSEMANTYVYVSSQKKKEIRMFRQVKDNGFTQHADFLMKGIGEHIPVRYTPDGMLLELCVDKNIGPEESYEIHFDRLRGWVITGTDEAGLFSGIKMFLSNATWTETGFVAKETECVVIPTYRIQQ